MPKHRRSIRLKGHDYAGGGVYFVTICAHRDAGDIFAPPDVREMVAKEWENATGAGNWGNHEGCGKKGNHEGCPYIYFGGWHSPKEKEIFHWLLKNKRKIIACPAWGIGAKNFSFIKQPFIREALEENRMLILEMRDTSGNLAAAEARNRFIIEHADALFTPYIAKGGMLERLLKEIPKEKIL